MTEDLRCCGTGTCLINSEGVCWCGQRWDGSKMCFDNGDTQLQVSAASTVPQVLPSGPELTP